MKKLLSVILKALVFGMVIYFFLGDLFPKIKESDVVKETTKKIKKIGELTEQKESVFKFDEEKGMAYFLTDKPIKNAKIKFQQITAQGKMWDTLELQKTKIGEQSIMYWVNLDEDKLLNAELITE